MFHSNSLAFNAISKILNCRCSNNSAESPFLSEEDILLLVNQACAKLDEEPAVLSIDGQVNVVGDIHGNLDGLLRYFDALNYPPVSNIYLFLGDYVDRGTNSVEVMIMLYSLKILFPHQIYLLRGNHECESLTSQYEFKKECESNVGLNVYNKIVESFNFLPIAAIINNTIFCVHGGISPRFKSRKDMDLIQKTTQDPVASGLVGELLWTDFEKYAEGFDDNERGCGYTCGESATSEFLTNCNFSLIIRSHQLCEEGFLWTFGTNRLCLTIFGCVDYMGKVNNAACATVSSSNEISFKLFHPLMKSQKNKRRVTLPDWLIQNSSCQKEALLLYPERSLSEPCAFPE